MAESIINRISSDKYNGNGVNEDITNRGSSNPYTTPSKGYVMIYLERGDSSNRIDISCYTNGWSALTAIADPAYPVVNSLYILENVTVRVINNTTTDGKVFFRGIK